MKYALIVLALFLTACQPVAFSCTWEAGEAISDVTPKYWTMVLDIMDWECE